MRRNRKKPKQATKLPRNESTLSISPSLWFTYFLIKNRLKAPSLSLHSFRHTMTVKLELARTDGSLMRRLQGHSLGNDVESRGYLGSLTYDVKELQTALEAVKFPAPLG